MSERDAPLLLAVESATPALSVALCRGAAVLAERRGPEGRHHAEMMLPLVDDLLEAAGSELAAVEAFAVAIGPGAFTSLRIGLATVKGFALGTGRRVAPVSTLRALATAGAEACDATEVWIALLDAGRGEWYAAAYRRGAVSGEVVLETALEEGIFDLAGLVRALSRAELADAGSAARVVGSGAERLCAALAAEQRSATPLDRQAPGAGVVGRLAAATLARGEGLPANELVPVYLRRSQAEELRDSRGA